MNAPITIPATAATVSALVGAGAHRHAAIKGRVCRADAARMSHEDEMADPEHCDGCGRTTFVVTGVSPSGIHTLGRCPCGHTVGEDHGTALDYRRRSGGDD